MRYTAGMRVLHTADVHLRNDTDERWEALGTVLDAAGSLAADVVAISGDLFDRDIDAQDLKTRVRQRFESCPAKILLIPGNHDDKGIRAGDFFGANVALLAGATTVEDIGSVRFVGLPFEEAGIDRTLSLIHDVAQHVHPERTNILLFHGELLDSIPEPGAFGDEKGRDYMPVRRSSFDALGFNYVLAGHFHRSFGAHQYAGGYFVYPGSPVSITRKETGRRYVDIVDVGQPPAAHAIDSSHFVNIDINLSPFIGKDPLAEVERPLQELHRMARVCVTIGGFVDLTPAGITETEFAESVRLLTNRYGVQDLVSRWRDVGAILHHDLFRRFEEKLAEAAGDGERREEIRNLVIRAMMEAEHAR